MKTERNAEPGPASRRVLVVDDEEIVLVALRETLRQQGYDVQTASSGVTALDLVRREVFAIVLSDQQMPALTGLEFLSQVRKLQPETSRILITAVLNVTTVIDAINKAEVHRFILKPWQREDLLRAVQGGVERYAAAVARTEQLQRSLRENERLTRLNLNLTEQLRALDAGKQRAGR